MLAVSTAGAGSLAHRLVDFNPAEVRLDRRWCGAGTSQNRFVSPSTDAWLPRVALNAAKYPQKTHSCKPASRNAHQIAVIECYDLADPDETAGRYVKWLSKRHMSMAR